ncbi:MAG: 50S ribosomal protein L23 [Sphaerochaetaceae bacterium]|jgi:large subunit ribosomal protein L23|nr:50S ribosomal protein L23 [Sphaerochaetaceae bacterium]
MNANQVIISPILSEKSNIVRSLDEKKYTFKVDPRANKIQIVAAVESLYKVTVLSCNVINVKGKTKFSRGKGGSIPGDTGSWKKAVVTVKKGDAINAFEGV